MTSATTAPDRLHVEGLDLECRWTGERDPVRVEIVLLHEGLGSLAMWKDFPARLSEATGRAVFAWSRQGYGASSPLPLPREPDYMHREAIALVALLRAACIERPILFGHSDGASIALIYAAAHPDGVAALVLEAPHVFVEHVTLASIAEARTTFETTDLAAKLGRYHRDPNQVFQRWNDIWLDPRFKAWNIERGLEAIACPMLLIQGEDDEYGTRAQLDAIHARAPQAQVLMPRPCGHSPHRDQPAAVLAAVSGFLEKSLGADPHARRT